MHWLLAPVQDFCEIRIVRWVLAGGCASGEMADTPDLGSGPARGGGSSPLSRTISPEIQNHWPCTRKKLLVLVMGMVAFWPPVVSTALQAPAGSVSVCCRIYGANPPVQV